MAKILRWKCLNNMGSLYYRLNNHEESRKCFEKGISYAEASS